MLSSTKSFRCLATANSHNFNSCATTVFVLNTGYNLPVLRHIGLPGVRTADQASSVCLLPQGPTAGGSDFGLSLCSLGSCAGQAGQGMMLFALNGEGLGNHPENSPQK